MSDQWKRYEIEGRPYYQRSLGMLQTTLFLETISGLVFSSVNAWGLFQAIGRRMGRVAAILLIPEGMDGVQFARQLEMPPYLDETAETFGAYLSPDQALEVLEDFLIYNRASSVLARAVKVMDRLLALQEQSSLPDKPTLPPTSSLSGSAPSSGTEIPEPVTASLP